MPRSTRSDDLYLTSGSEFIVFVAIWAMNGSCNTTLYCQVILMSEIPICMLGITSRAILNIAAQCGAMLQRMYVCMYVCMYMASFEQVDFLSSIQEVQIV